MAIGTSQKVPVVSAELFIIPLEDDNYIVYAPLRRAAFVANSQVVNFLADLQEGIYDEKADVYLVEFLRGLKILDANPEAPPITVFHGTPEPTSITLFLTTACNLRCTYCYASAGDNPIKVMTLDVAKRGIDFIAANALKRGETAFTITYHGGGEPTANWHTMTESLSYARGKAAQSGMSARAFAGTNGVLTDSQIDWIVNNLDGVTLSFDGLPEAHDRHRLTISGQGSSGRVMHTMRRFDEAGFPYSVRITATSSQIQLLPDSVDFICSHFQPSHIQVEPAYQMGRWRNAPSSETEEFIKAFREAQQRANRYGREIRFSAARLGTLTNHFCGISQDSFTLSPDGNVSACYEVFSEESPSAKTFFYGHPDRESNGYKFNLPVLNNLRNQAVQHREYCKGCFAKWTCAGDCYHKSLSISGSKEFAGSDRCHITRELTKDQILARIADSGGLFWHESTDSV